MTCKKVVKDCGGSDWVEKIRRRIEEDRRMVMQHVRRMHRVVNFFLLGIRMWETIRLNVNIFLALWESDMTNIVSVLSK